MAMTLKNIGLRIIAAICLILGLATVWTPIPTGLVLLAIGMALMLMTSKRAVRVVRRFRRRYPKIDEHLHNAETQMPSRLAKTLRRTNVRIKNTATSAGDKMKSVRKGSKYKKQEV